MRRHKRILTAQELTERVKSRRPTIPHIGRDFYYIVTKQDGRMVLLGPYNDEREAEEVAVEKINTAYEVVQMPTRDRSKATQMLRHKILRSDGGDLATSLRRMRHTI
ncbi:MAG TPA: hypothetical protein VMW50_14930 [Dehalococcoidia bacterium]|nr:hypothetical protein [Dehalococcoidia bacterium]